MARERGREVHRSGSDTTPDTHLTRRIVTCNEMLSSLVQRAVREAWGGTHSQEVQGLPYVVIKKSFHY